jgi:hypothetical protein
MVVSNRDSELPSALRVPFIIGEEYAGRPPISVNVELENGTCSRLYVQPLVWKLATSVEPW